MYFDENDGGQQVVEGRSETEREAVSHLLIDVRIS